MKKDIKFIVCVVLILLFGFFALNMVHKCDDCEKWFVGAGYEANILADVISDDDQTICKSCAEKQHILEIKMGKPINEFKKNIFE